MDTYIALLLFMLIVGAAVTAAVVRRRGAKPRQPRRPTIRRDSMKKYTPPLPIGLAILALCGLGFYGFKAWYFVGSDTLLLMIPIGVVGLVLGVRVWQGVRHRYAEKQRRGGPVVSALLVACFMILAFGRGAPALAMRLMGPDAQIAATVYRKERGSRRCRRQIYLAEYWPSRLCVDERQYEALEQGERVLLNVRMNALGTFIFSIESKDARR